MNSTSRDNNHPRETALSQQSSAVNPIESTATREGEGSAEPAQAGRPGLSAWFGRFARDIAVETIGGVLAIGFVALIVALIAVL